MDNMESSCPNYQEGTEQDAIVKGSVHSRENGSSSRCPFQPNRKLSKVQRVTEKPPQQQSVVRFIVKDYGCGIAPDAFLKIFQPFLQASGHTEAVYGGTGLGLAITSRLVDRLGGTITVDSELGKWSEFKVELPAEGCCFGDREGLSKQLKNAHVLYVSCKQNQMNLVKTLNFYNLSAEKFETGNDLHRRLTTKCHDESKFYFLLVHEGLYQPEMNQWLLEHSGTRNALITTGPKRLVTESKWHIRSLSQLLPTVMIESFLAFMEEAKNMAASSGATTDVAEVQSDKPCFEDLDVLIAEDNIVNQKVLNGMLRRLGMRNIQIAQNGKEAVEMTLNYKYDLVFMVSI